MQFFLKTLLVIYTFVCCNNTPEKEIISLSQAFIIETKIASGCFLGHKIIEDVGKSLQQYDKKNIELKISSNENEDISIQKSLFVVFPFTKTSKNSLLIIELIPISTNVPKLDLFEINLSKQGYYINISPKIDIQKHFQTKLYFSDTASMIASFMTCSEAGFYEPQLTNYFNIYPLESNTEGNKISSLFADEIEHLNIAKKYLNVLQKAYSEGIYQWNKSKIETKSFDFLIQNPKILVNLKLDTGEEITNTKNNFVAHLKQKILINKGNKKIGAEIKIRVN